MAEIELTEREMLIARKAARLQRHAKAGGWRGKVASWIGDHLLDDFDPDGGHL